MQTQDITKHLQELKTEIELIIPEPALVNKMFVAGGCIRSMVRDQKIADYDIFLPDEGSVQELREALAYRQVMYQSKNSIGLLSASGKHIQFIVCAVGTPEQIVSEFDFTCNMSHFSFGTSELVIHSDSLSNQLVINPNARNVMGTFLRVGKFVNKGYAYPSRLDMIALGIKLTKHDPIDKYSELEESSRMAFSESETQAFEGVGFNIIMDVTPRSSDRIGSAGGA